ncbi:hypothetical protein RN001_006719 [Aquatica leii]|uniref:Uncharacterized protein n=1 Tax=Aquatica leii TaxID=1421715 RepID=A0AAN7Q919_9COLE|nr:hypothetical protein RN001_006719 [Aquatica leii]
MQTRSRGKQLLKNFSVSDDSLNDVTYDIEDHILIKWNDEMYPGKITSISADAALVKYEEYENCIYLDLDLSSNLSEEEDVEEVIEEDDEITYSSESEETMETNWQDVTDQMKNIIEHISDEVIVQHRTNIEKINFTDHTYIGPSSVNEVEVVTEEDRVIDTSEAVEIPNDENINKADWSKYTPAKLRTPISKALRGHVRPDPLRSKPGKWTSAKAELVELQKKCFLEEFQLKMRHLQEKHEKSLSLQEEEIRERLRLLNEKHTLERQILMIQKSNLLK